MTHDDALFVTCNCAQSLIICNNPKIDCRVPNYSMIDLYIYLNKSIICLSFDRRLSNLYFFDSSKKVIHDINVKQCKHIMQAYIKMYVFNITVQVS